jgi:hypothetical protein
MIIRNHQLRSPQTSLAQSFKELFPAVETLPVRQFDAENLPATEKRCQSYLLTFFPLII